MGIEVTAVANGDDVIVCWRTDGKVVDCVGYAIEREVKGKAPTYLRTEMPFHGDPKPASVQSKPSSEWPIQRFLWTDHLAPSAVKIRYRVKPVFITEAVPKATVDETASSKPTDWITCGTRSTKGFALYPNRGIVASASIERKLEARLAQPANANKTIGDLLEEITGTPGDAIREQLAGTVLPALRAEFARAAKAGEELHVALYELRDTELADLLISAGDRCHVILGNGAFKAGDLDPNEVQAGRLEDAGIDVQRRMVSTGHFAHNKFIVFGPRGKGRVWTGSTNWTPSGLCTQANHAVVIEDAALADGFLDYWGRLQVAGSAYPKELAQQDSVAAPSANARTRAWFAPVVGEVDLADARQLIRGAAQGALFLMFRPGNTKTLVDEITGLHTKGLFIRGVLNTNALGPNTKSTLDFFNKSAKAQRAKPELILPDHLQAAVGPFSTEVGIFGPLIHSKTIVLDPFGAHPVVMTGSHNLGTKASRSNDDNLVIIEDAPGIAQEFAVMIMNVYDQYQWRYQKGLRAKALLDAQAAAKAAGTPIPTTVPGPQWDGPVKSDSWQNPSYLAAASTESRFWFGG